MWPGNNNNKKKLKSMKSQNNGLPSGCKIYINESLSKHNKKSVVEM